MSTQYPDLFAALAASFDDVEVRVRAQAGRQLHYITARTAMNRLDDVVGPENWWDDYTPGQNSVICRLTLRLPDGTTITKADAGGYAGMADSGDDDKSGFSDAFKRAAAKFGVARYLYRDGVPEFARLHTPAPAPAPTPDSKPAPARDRDDREHDDPRNGRQLYAWLKRMEERHEIRLLNKLTTWAKMAGLPNRMSEWTDEQASAGLTQAKYYLAPALAS